MKEMYGDQFGEFVCGYWGLKGSGVSPQKWMNESTNQKTLQQIYAKDQQENMYRHWYSHGSWIQNTLTYPWFSSSLMSYHLLTSSIR